MVLDVMAYYLCLYLIITGAIEEWRVCCVDLFQ